MRAIQHLDQEKPRSTLNQIGRGRAALHFDAAFGVNIDNREHQRIERRLNLAHRFGFIVVRDRVVYLTARLCRKRLPQKDESVFESAHLLREWLQRHAAGIVRSRRANRENQSEISQAFHDYSDCIEDSGAMEGVWVTSANHFVTRKRMPIGIL